MGRATHQQKRKYVINREGLAEKLPRRSACSVSSACGTKGSKKRPKTGPKDGHGDTVELRSISRTETPGSYSPDCSEEHERRPLYADRHDGWRRFALVAAD